MRSMLASRDRLFWGGLVALVLLFAVWQCWHLDGYRWDWDEGVYALTARSVAEGQQLYGDVFSMAPPLFIVSLQWAFRVLGDSLPAGRAVIVFYATLGLLGVGLLAREWGGRLAGCAAVIVLALAPHFYMLSRVIIADIPSLGLSCLALWMAVRYERSGRWRWLVGCGLILAWGILLKLTAGLVAPVIVFLVLLRDLDGVWVGRQAWGPALRRVAWSALALGVPVLAPLAIVLWAYPTRPLLDQVVVLLRTQQDTFVPDWTANALLVGRYLVWDNFNIALNRGLTALGIAGAVALAFRSRNDAFVWTLWTAIVLLVLLGYAPLWPHLLSPVLFPLAVGAGVAVGRLYQLLHAGWQTGRTAQGTALLVLLFVAVGMYGYDLPGILVEDARRGRAPDSAAAAAAIAFLRQRTAPDDYVLTDEPLLAYYADRRVPPNLIDCSVVRIASGQLTVADLMRATEDFAPAAVVLWRDSRFSVYLSDYVAWLQERYVLGWEEDGDGRIYLVRR